MDHNQSQQRKQKVSAKKVAAYFGGVFVLLGVGILSSSLLADDGSSQLATDTSVNSQSATSALSTIVVQSSETSGKENTEDTKEEETPDETNVADEAQSKEKTDTSKDNQPVNLTGQANLDMILSSPHRNTNHDASPFLNTPSAQLPVEELYGPRSEYQGNPEGNPEHSFPIPAGGQFRTSCEFSHFSYDDALVFPKKPGASHLHMYFGNTHVNAFSTYDTLLNSGSSTCNGQELNRTGYWVPAMFDSKGNVRIPERIVVYYKGEGLANGDAQPYPPEAAMITASNINTLEGPGSALGQFSFKCSDNFSLPQDPAANIIPDCNGDRYAVGQNRTVLEMNVKFPQCWNGKDASDPNNFSVPAYGGWFGSDCQGQTTFTNLEYFVNYVVDKGEDTSGWYLSSDVNPKTSEVGTPGATVHGDWWGGWHRETNQMFLDNCVNNDSFGGCGMGYLTDGGPDYLNPLPGPALKYRPQYTGPQKVSAEDLRSQLCPNPAKTYSQPADAAYCAPLANNHGDHGHVGHGVNAK